jgi:hypothetical protein
MAKKKKPAVYKTRCYDAIRPISGAGIHKDKRTKRLRTRKSQLRKEIDDV